MGDLIPIIVTGGGAPGIAGTIHCLRNNPAGVPFRVIATDMREDVPGRYLADAFYTVPPPESEGYLDALAGIIRREKVKAVLPQTTREIEVLSEHAALLAETGAVVVVSSHMAIRAANDKYELLNRAVAAGVPCPDYYLTDSYETLIEAARALGYPGRKVVVKPRVSNGMRGLRIVTETPWTVADFLSRKPDGSDITMANLERILENGVWPELLVTGFLSGIEYTVDVFRGKEGTLAIPRRRDVIRSGITFESTVELRDDIADYSVALAQALDLRYCFGFQFKLDDNGVPRLLESNPRVQGTMAASEFAGFNMIYNAVAEALGTPVSLDGVLLTDGVSFKRYWGGIASHDSRRIGSV